jgi:transposase
LESLAAAYDEKSYAAARDILGKSTRGAHMRQRPIVLPRGRDGRIVRDAEGRFAAVLHILKVKEEQAAGRKVRKAFLREGVDPNTGEILPPSRTSTQLVVPVEMSKWHQHRFMQPGVRLGSSLVYCRDGEWFMAAQYEMPQRTARVTGAVVGVDRGVKHAVAVSVVDAEGRVIETPPLGDEDIGQRIGWANNRRRQEAKRRGRTSARHLEFVDHALHKIANELVALAARHGAEISLEKLDQFKQLIVAPRKKGTRKGGWRVALKKAQLAKLETLLTYKLNLAGLPKPRFVAAGGTSQTCASCGHVEPANRKSRDEFVCVACGHEAHADQNASIVIGRRGVLMRDIRKGQKLNELHKNMVAKLRDPEAGGVSPATHGGGPGPGGGVSVGVVQVRGSIGGANEDASPATPSMGQKSSNSSKTAPPGRYSQRGTTQSKGATREKPARNQQVASLQLELPLG